MSMLIQAGLSTAEKAINGALQYDPASQAKLGALEGKLLCLEVMGLPAPMLAQSELSSDEPLQLWVRFGYPLQLMSHSEIPADATLSGELSAFVNVATHQDKQQALMKSDLQIRGSSQLALSLADVMAQLDIDWEAMLSQFIGPVMAHVIGRRARGLFGWLKQTGEKVKNDWVEYIRDEAQMAVHPQEAEQQYRAIHQLRLDTDRLEARIQRLAQQLK